MFISYTLSSSYLLYFNYPVCLSLCLVAGFIDFIVEPTFSGLIDTTEKVIGPLIEEDRKARETGNRRSRYHYYSINKSHLYCQRKFLHKCNTQDLAIENKF